ncbi:MAG: prepilin peptidase [Planctomycetota bacterium]
MDLLVVVIIFAGLLGAMVGSFLNVVIYRLPRGLSVAHPKRSFCPSCSRQIRWSRNIPILSWLLLNGRCADCQAPIPFRYFAVELATAILFTILAAMRFAGLVEPGPEAFLLLAADCLMASLLVAIAVIDFQHAIIPDPLTVPWMPLMVLLVWLQPDLLRGKMLDPATLETGPVWPVAALAGLAAGGLPALFFDFLSRRRVQVEAGSDPESALPGEDEEFSIWREARQMALPLLLPAALGSAALVLLTRGLDLSARPELSAALSSAAGAGMGLLFVYAIRFLFSALFAREAMGLGDAKFLGLAGALLGVEGSLLVFLLACALGSIPAILGLLLKAPLATAGLLVAAILPLVALEPMAEALSPGVALAVLVPVPLLALLFFFRHLRRSGATLTAMPFGPFLVVAALVLLVGWAQAEALLRDFLEPILGR